MLSRPRRPTLLFVWLVTVGQLLASAHALAQLPTSGPSATPAEAAADGEARRHFEQALELYRSGRYALARDELKAAAALDPNGKDLFFNLALVYEKLGQLNDAIAALERYQELETEPKERERAQATIARLRGAERAAVDAQLAAAAAPCAPEPAPAPPSRLTPVVLGAASVAVVSLVVGSIFGAKALADDPADERTSATLSIEALRARGARAEREAIVADVAFAVAAASVGTAITVWALQPTEPKARSAGVTLRGYF
jgi:tetratricopeptide (TPR) repeat protein